MPAKLSQNSFFLLIVVSIGSQAARGAGYDPQKDVAYQGFKYRPGQGFTTAKYRLPAKPNCIRDVTATIKVSGTLDGGGCLYRFRGSWNGKSFKQLCFAPQEISEGTPPMFELQPGAALKNLQIECALDGVHTTRNNLIDNVVFRDVEEDAITLGENITVKNSTFWFCNDKCLQMNRANRVTIQNNRFYYVGGTAVLANYGYDVTVSGNRLYNAKRGIRSRTIKSLVRASGNVAEGSGNCFLEAQDKGVLEDLGGNSATGVQNFKCEIDGGRVVNKSP